MLSEIFKISAGSDFKSSKKNQRTIIRPVPVYRGSESDKYDSADLSPALLLLKELKWLLKEIRSDLHNNYYLAFCSNDLRFEVKLNISDIILNYIISKETKSGDEKKIIEVNLLFHPSIDFNNSENTGIVYLNFLFERIYSFNSVVSFNRDEDKSIDTLVEGFEKEISAELNFISLNLISFIEKLTYSKFTIPRLPDEKAGLVILNSVKTL